MSKGTLKIHSENILPIIKKWLYTDRDIFVRELVSNACDALSKIKLLRDRENLDIKDEDLNISLKIDKEAKTITISDTGIGMTRDEVKKYIAQLAFSGAEEFFDKYEKTDGKDQVIGHFGLGFYSAFMVSERVDIDTLSYQEDADAAFWSCDGSHEYTLKKGKRTERGTTITLHVNEESLEFLDEISLRTVLKKHCLFLPFPITLDGSRINEQEPLWIKSASECTDEEYLTLYRTLYPLEPDPIFWIHLNVDYPFNLQGVLFFPKITKQFDYQNSKHLQLYCNRVFVSDNCKDLIPEYLSVLRGIIDSPDIPLNVSRSALQMDKTVRQLSTHIAKKVADKLISLYQTDREKYLSSWPDIEMIIKLGILNDPKFYERVQSALVWQNTDGDWTTLPEYLERNQEKTDGTIFYHSHDKEEKPLVLEMYTEKGIEVLSSRTYIDTPLFNFLESKLEKAKIKRIDGTCDDLILDKENADNPDIAAYFTKALEKPDVEIDAKSLSHAALPAFLKLDEQERRMRDYMALTKQAMPDGFGAKKHLILNTNNTLVQSVYSLKEQNPELSKMMAEQIYNLTLLAQKEMPAQGLSRFITQSNAVLTECAKSLSTPHQDQEELDPETALKSE